MATSNCLGSVKLLINISGRMAWGDQILDGAQIVLIAIFIIFSVSGNNSQDSLEVGHGCVV